MTEEKIYRQAIIYSLYLRDIYGSPHRNIVHKARTFISFFNKLVIKDARLNRCIFLSKINGVYFYHQILLYILKLGEHEDIQRMNFYL
jgi:hypothetical protein